MLSNSSSLQPGSTPTIPILAQKSVDRCHVLLPDSAIPASAILSNGDFYVYVKFFPTLESAYRGANRLIDRGNAVILTRIPKGLVLWVLEREAQLIQKSPTQTAKTEKSVEPGSTPAIPILAQKSVDRCHVLLPDSAIPASAILSNGDFYVYVKFFPTLESAHRGANRLIDRGNAVMLTRIPKGLVLWVLEHKAQLIQKSPTWPAKTERYIQKPKSTNKRL